MNVQLWLWGCLFPDELHAAFLLTPVGGRNAADFGGDGVQGVSDLSASCPPDSAAADLAAPALYENRARPQRAVCAPNENG